MQPPAGRIRIGDVVRTPDARTGTVVTERQVSSSGAWQYRVEFANGGESAEFLDYELKVVPTGEPR
jgi:hypothetical protein